MKESAITQLAIYMSIDSYVTVTNPDGTTASFSTPGDKRPYEAIKEELELTAYAYIDAIMSTKFVSIGKELANIDIIGATPLN